MWLALIESLDSWMLDDGNIVLMIKDANILYYHMDVVISTLLGHSLFSGVDYMNVKVLIWAMNPFLDSAVLN